MLSELLADHIDVINVYSKLLNHIVGRTTEPSFSLQYKLANADTILFKTGKHS